MNEPELRKWILKIVESEVKHLQFSCDKHRRDPEACIGLKRTKKALEYLSNLWQGLDK